VKKSHQKRKGVQQRMFKAEVSNFDIKQVLGADLEEVDAIIAAKNEHIERISIPKKSGGKRNIIAPDARLKYIQKSIYWRVFRRYKADAAAHGFVAKKGIVTNAELHVGAKSLGKIDIKDFFDSISTDHLKNCIFGNKHICRYCKRYERMLDGRCHPSLYYNKTKNCDFRCEEIKAVYIPEYCRETGYISLFNRIIELCTFEGYTAQGFPTSPMLANIVMRGFDQSMKKHCASSDIAYTRYADDLAFSSKTLSKFELKKEIKQKAYQLLWAYGFTPNKKKTIWKSNAGRLKICGVVVNVKKSVQRRDVHKFRAEVHHATVKHADKTTKSDLRKLKGWASFLMSIDRDKGKKYMKQLLAFENKKFKLIEFCK